MPFDQGRYSHVSENNASTDAGKNVLNHRDAPLKEPAGCDRFAPKHRKIVFPRDLG
jgi:hypothetical protein